MTVQRLADPLAALVDPSWPPMRHVARGIDRIGPAGLLRVTERVRAAAQGFSAPEAKRPALRRLFSFLSQVEVIAIEVPLSALPSATATTRPLLLAQLEDEVFHSLLFAHLAGILGGLDRPIPEAETLLDQIRAQPDPRTTAVLLNAIAEAWIENLFEAAASWGVADDVFRTVLADEARHVEEAAGHAAGVDAAAVEPAVRAFETELFKLAQHPRVLLPVYAAAGEAAFRRLSASFLRVHVRALSSVGLSPDPALAGLEARLDELEEMPWLPEDRRPRLVAPESQWRRTALELWDTPRHPVMQGWFDVEAGHIPRRLLTPIFVAAVGRVWSEYARMNRYTWAGKVWSLPTVNVGVRVAIGTTGEALSTIVIPQAETRSVRDIVRILQAGVAKMNELEGGLADAKPDPQAEALATVLLDAELMAMAPPETVACPVTVSNLGRLGLHAGFGSMPGSLGQSVELIVGRVEARPVWRRWRYKPAPVVTIAAGADHRVVDGNHAAEAIRRLEAAMSPDGVRAILARPDTLAGDGDVADEVLAELGVSKEEMQLAMSCKLPFWLGWLCWLFKK